MTKQHLLATFLVLLLLAIDQLVLVQTVNLARYDKLKREEFLELDRDVTNYYTESYETLTKRNETYDQHLFRSIRSLRHTAVINQFDYRYNSDQIMRNSSGQMVNDELCAVQLSALVEMSRRFVRSMKESGQDSIPLSAMNFFESSGRAESGTLNGNILWWGSYSTCIRAKISGESASKYLDELAQRKSMDNEKTNEQEHRIQGKRVGDIKGRYCVAHLRAKSWPKYDKFFEDRISIKMALCMPETCHTSSYIDSKKIQQDVDFLARHNLVAPYNSDRYEISYLYCLPDEDSPFRQFDLGTKLFIAFCVAWTILVVYTNIKYMQRLKTMRKLRDSVDIRMVINQRRQSDNGDSEVEATDGGDEGHSMSREITTRGGDESEAGQRARAEVGANKSKKTKASQQKSSTSTKSAPTSAPSVAISQKSLKLPDGGSASRSSSANPSPVASDVEENDGEFNVIRPIVSNKKQATTRSRENGHSSKSSGTEHSASEGFDLIKAFAVKSNLDYLFKTRDDESQAKKAGSNHSFQQANMNSNNKRLSQQLSAVSRRTSSSNEALIKDLQETNERDGDAMAKTKTKFAIIAGDTSGQKQQQQELEDEIGKKRINIDIFDGIKVFATSWIIYGHTLMFFFGLVKDLRFGDERMLDFVLIATINTLQIVSLFYIITGALITYLAFSRQKIKHLLQPTFWILVIIARYVRLFPTYFLVFWFAKHVAPYTGSGPFWYDYRTDSEHCRGYCAQESWLTMITMSAADVKIPLDCIPQSWYLSNDFRTLLILPFYVVLLAKNRKAGYLAILSTFVYSSARLLAILREANIDYKVLLQWRPHVYSILADRLHDVYTDMPVRLSTYLLGVLVGHMLYLYENRQIKKWPHWFDKHGMKIGLTIGAIFLMGAPILASPYINRFLPAADEVDSDTAVMLIPVFKGAIEIAISLVLLRLISGGGYKWVADLFSSKLAKVLANVSYAVFLIHVEIMYKVPATKFESSYWFLFSYSCFFITLSNLFGFFIYLFYEMPISNLIRYVFKKILKLVVK